MRDRYAARAEGEGQLPVRGDGPYHGRRGRVAFLGQTLSPSSATAYSWEESGLRSVIRDEGVVVALDLEGARAVGRAPDQHLDLAGGVGLHPDGGVAAPA